MANYRLFFKRSVPKDLRPIPRLDVAKILARLNEIALDPRGPGSEKLSAQERYRLRQGDYRILYEVDDVSRTVVIVKVCHRKEAYRGR